MKKILSILLVAVMALSLCLSFASCGKEAADEKGGEASAKKVGVILVGDETEGYTLAHMDGIDAAKEATGVEVVYKKKVEETDACASAAKELIANGCTMIISNSYGHQDYMAEVAEEYPDVDFVAMTGDYAAISGLDNMYNAFTDVYESRYVSGVIAGMKLKELVDAGKLTDKNYEGEDIKLGYVGAFTYAEVVSGYTAYYLGVKSIVENVVMDVQFTQSWFDVEKEAAAAEYLAGQGCVIISQHADSTGAPSAIQKLQDDKKQVVYSVGYNIDMLEVAPKAALTSATNNWSIYYTQLFKNFVDGKAPVQDWSEGYSADAVGTTKLGESCAEGTQEKVDEVIAALKDGSLKVFDTSKFTVGGEKVTTSIVDLSYFDFSGDAPKVIYEGEKKEAIKTENGISYFAESEFRAAPYFALNIDGIVNLGNVGE